jgi:hypothetical protein
MKQTEYGAIFLTEISWINSWTSIGRHNRVVIPCCAVKCIREKFPEISGNYIGFKEVEEVYNINMQ